MGEPAAGSFLHLSNNRALRAVLTFFSSRVLGGGPRLLGYVGAFFALLILVTQVLPLDFGSTVAIFGETEGGVAGGIWDWLNSVQGQPSDASQPGPEASNQTGLDIDYQFRRYDGSGGGLRVVVFGESDVATQTRRRKDKSQAEEAGWTEQLCSEVRGHHSCHDIEDVER